MCAFRTLAMSRKRSTIKRIRPHVHLPRTVGNCDAKTKGWTTSVTYDVETCRCFPTTRLDLTKNWHVWTAEIIRYVKWYVANIRQVICGQYTSSGMWPIYEALENARNNQAKKNLGIMEYDILAITPAANRMWQLLTWLRLQYTIDTKRTAHEYKDSSPHQYYPAATHFSTAL
jgi:hypothetical protein